MQKVLITLLIIFFCFLLGIGLINKNNNPNLSNSYSGGVILSSNSNFSSYTASQIYSPPTQTVSSKQTFTFNSAPVYVPPVEYCCKHCVKGKACGDTCISRSKTCHVGPGCACDY